MGCIQGDEKGPMSEETTETRAAARIGVWLARQKCTIVRVSEYAADVQLADVEMRSSEETAAEVAELLCAVNEGRGKFVLFAMNRDGRKKDLVTVARFTLKLEGAPSTSAAGGANAQQAIDLETFVNTLLTQIGNLTQSQTSAVSSLMGSFTTMMEAVNKRLALAERRAELAEGIARDATDLASTAASGVGREERRDKMWSLLENVVEEEIKDRFNIRSKPAADVVDVANTAAPSGGNGAAS
jgi:hypothetical protein